jgi:hypothetical protein
MRCGYRSANLLVGEQIVLESDNYNYVQLIMVVNKTAAF